MKRVLMLATVPSMIGQFNMSNIFILKELGYEIFVACNFNDTSVWNKKRIDMFIRQLKELKVFFYQVDFERNAFNFKYLLKAYHQVIKLIENKKINLIHCHTPVGGVIGRLAGRKNGIKVIYTAHGLHFYKGAPLKNWFIYYPIERYLSHYTDILLTINQEDYQFAQAHLKAKITYYIPGVGIDLKQFNDCNTRLIREDKRKELNIITDSILLLSVGELNKNKNHEVVIKAIDRIKNNKIFYFICGQGELNDYLISIIKSKGLEDKVILLGYRTDIRELYLAADIFIFPSKREGLPVSLMEAMACGLPVICNKIRGNVDLIENGKGGYLSENPLDIDWYCQKIEKLSANKGERECMKRFNKKKVYEFRIEKTQQLMKNIYKTINF